MRSWWVRFLIGFGLLYGVLGGLAEIDATGRWGLPVLAIVLATALAVEWWFAHTRPAAALRALGFGRPAGRALGAALAVSALILLVYPLAAAVTGEPVAVRADWPWLLVGIFAFHGLAEELVWRGYAFRRLRTRYSFLRAVAWTAPLIAVTHLPIVARSGVAVGLAAMLVAAVTALPLAHLFEAGGHTVWAPAVVHTAIDSFKLVLIPEAGQQTFSLLLATVSLVVPLLVLAVPAADRT